MYNKEKNMKIKSIVNKIHLNPRSVVALRLKNKDNVSSIYWIAEELEISEYSGAITIGNQYGRQIYVDIRQGFYFRFDTNSEKFEIEEYTNIVGDEVVKLKNEEAEISISFVE